MVDFWRWGVFIGSRQVAAFEAADERHALAQWVNHGIRARYAGDQLDERVDFAQRCGMEARPL
jgi:hypothetical protein